MKNLDWGEVDLTLYDETFVGRAIDALSVSASYIPPQNAASAQLPTPQLQLDLEHRQDGILARERQSQSAFCTTIEMEITAHMPQIASLGIPAQPAREDIPIPNALTGAVTLTQAGIPLILRANEGSDVPKERTQTH